MCRCFGLTLALVAGTAFGLVSGCGSDTDAAPSQAGQPTQSAPSIPKPSLPPGIRPAPSPEMIWSVTDGFYLGGQPERSDLEELHVEGVKTVMDLRMPDETRDYDEPSTVIDGGMRYIHLGFTPDSLNDKILDEAREHMRDVNNQPMLVHCASANRVGAVWLAFRVLDDGVSEEAALAEAKSVGLRSKVMEEKVLEYTRKNKGK